MAQFIFLRVENQGKTNPTLILFLQLNLKILKFNKPKRIKSKTQCCAEFTPELSNLKKVDLKDRNF